MLRPGLPEEGIEKTREQLRNESGLQASGNYLILRDDQVVEENLDPDTV